MPTLTKLLPVKTILEILTLSTDYLTKQDMESPRREAELLLAEFLGLRRMDLYLDFERPLQDKEVELFRDRLKRRGHGEPGQYIHGSVSFYGLDLRVTPAVLIPRPETEILVDKIVAELASKDMKGKKCLDLCTGSGCIALALKQRFPELEVTAADISEDAVKLAQENAASYSLDVQFVQGDFLTPFHLKKFDYIISNPPYISAVEYHALPHEVRGFEPKQALLAGETGLEFYQKLSNELPLHMNSKGKVWFEIGAAQGPAVLSLFPGARLEKDWAGHDRFISLEFE